MNTKRIGPTRRWTAGMTSALAIFAMVGCADTANPVAPGPVAAAGNVLALKPPAFETQGFGDERSELGRQLAAVRAATSRFHDVRVAMAAGYPNPEGRICDQTPAGAMGIHSGNFALMTHTVDLLQPEVLLYLPKPGGGFRLIGVEYVQFVFLRNPATGQVAPWTSPDPWPASYQVVTPTPQLFGQTFQGPMPGHIPGMPWHWDLHAWVWAHNPNGTFAQWNPTLSCSN